MLILHNTHLLGCHEQALRHLLHPTSGHHGGCPLFISPALAYPPSFLFFQLLSFFFSSAGPPSVAGLLRLTQRVRSPELYFLRRPADWQPRGSVLQRCWSPCITLTTGCGHTSLAHHFCPSRASPELFLRQSALLSLPLYTQMVLEARHSRCETQNYGFYIVFLEVTKIWNSLWSVSRN